MERANRLDDVELTDPQAMRALAHPVRLAILDHLRRGGPATASRLAPLVGATPTVTSWHLRHLASFGLVRDSAPGPDKRERRWETVGHGFRFAAPVDPADVAGQSAASALARMMFAQYADLPQRWADEVEPDLEPGWRRLAGLFNTVLVISDDELAGLNDAIEAAMAPYSTRADGDRPTDARRVRIMRYTLPELAEGSDVVDDDGRGTDQTSPE